MLTPCTGVSPLCATGIGERMDLTVHSRAHAVPGLEVHESQTSSLVDVDSPHVVSVPSDYEEQEVKTETQATRMEREAEDKARAEAKKAEEKAEEKAQQVKQNAQQVKQKAAEKAKEAKAEVKKDARKLDENKDNPVFIGNAILWTVTAAAVGYGAYQKHKEGKLDIQLAGTVAAALGVLGIMDYTASK